MTKRVQIIGHDAETANGFIGEVREITVDTDNWELRLHDGTTPGGWKLLNRDQNDARYQARSVELDGLLGWEPNQRGIVTRLGPSYYSLRAIEVDSANLTIVNGNGYDGNPQIGLAPEITSDHTATGSWTFTQPIDAEGGVNGNIVGDTTGTHYGDVIGNVTGDLTGDAHGNHTGSFTGDLDTRGFSVMMDEGQIDPSWIGGLGGLLSQGAVPIGGIIDYWGDVGDIPSNWFICDGTNGTPDLRDRFIVGAGVQFPVDATGGSSTHTHVVTVDSGGAHIHTGTASPTALSVAQIPSHRHINGVVDDTVRPFNLGSLAASPVRSGAVQSNNDSGSLTGYTDYAGDGDPHGHSISIDSGGAHQHTGEAAAGSNIPPFFAMLKIMRGS